ncbi:MAG: TraB/GumN family protein [Kordiimonadaceae bacterium]|jgi:uncharacterized protein|nr:TraB/GumN family protein [Kordiimonadaceae bacterium]MBT6032575.1 TraB/GumN family protein [Kordiimonadaceae bacterium]
MIATKLRALFVLVVIAFPLSGIAQETALNAHPAVWLIEKGDSKTYMLGSVHLLSPEVKWYGGIIEKAMDTAEEVVFEVNMTPEKQREAGMVSGAQGIFSDGDSLRNYLSLEEYALLGTRATELGIPATAFESFKPWLVSISLSVTAVQKEGWDQESGVDKYIKTIADQRGVKISELETLEAQLATIWDHPLETQTKMLVDTLEELKDISNITKDMVGAWASGDAEKMTEVFLTPMMEQEDLFKSLVLDRNNKWIPVIEGLIAKEQTTFIVAGAAHFIGVDGVVNLLKEKGYDVKKVQ